MQPAHFHGLSLSSFFAFGLEQVAPQIERDPLLCEEDRRKLWASEEL